MALELIGAIEVRHGDGTFVRGPAARVGGITGSPLDAPPRELIETRLHIEPAVASLTARSGQHELLDALSVRIEEQQALVDKPLEIARFVELGLEFHADLAKGCGNAMLADIVAQLVDVERHPLWALVNQLALADTRMRQREVDQHRQIWEYVREGKADNAAEAMARHLEVLEQGMFKMPPSKAAYPRAT